MWTSWGHFWPAVVFFIQTFKMGLCVLAKIGPFSNVETETET